MYRVAINTAIVFFKERKEKVDKYEIVSENQKKTMIQRLKKVK
jgi:hypothetical protein